MLEINPLIKIDEAELDFTFIRADGPGGQNVNKVATAVQLRFDILNTPSLPDEAKERLIKLAGRRATQEGILVIDAKRYRTQERNREDALIRFHTLIQKAVKTPEVRRKTKPTKASQEKRLKNKRIMGKTKRSRQKSLNDNFD